MNDQYFDDQATDDTAKPEEGLDGELSDGGVPAETPETENLDELAEKELGEDDDDEEDGD